MPPRTTSSTMGFPPFRGAVRDLIIVNTGIYLVLLLLMAFRASAAQMVFTLGVLSVPGIKAGLIWQFLTYGFLHQDPLNFLFSMLAIYFLGTTVEARIRSRAFVEMYLVSLVGAGLIGFLLSLTGHIGAGAAYGSGPAANAILMVFYLLNRDAPIMLFPLPIPIPVKYIVIFTAAVEAAYLLIYHFPMFFIVQLVGLGMGYVWYRTLWHHSILGALGNWNLSLRNNYYRWKRRRAARKFQVYMRKHGGDSKQFFPEDPDKDKKDDRGPGGWVN